MWCVFPILSSMRPIFSVWPTRRFPLQSVRGAHWFPSASTWQKGNGEVTGSSAPSGLGESRPFHAVAFIFQVDAARFRQSQRPDDERDQCDDDRECQPGVDVIIAQRGWPCFGWTNGRDQRRGQYRNQTGEPAATAVMWHGRRRVANLGREQLDQQGCDWRVDHGRKQYLENTRTASISGL